MLRCWFKDSEQFTIVNILANHIELSALYENEKFVKESVKILAKYLELRDYKKENLNPEVAILGLVRLMINVELHSYAINMMEFSENFSQTDFTPILKVFKTMDWEEEYIFAIQSNYFHFVPFFKKEKPLPITEDISGETLLDLKKSSWKTV